jgi:hypothetical protein
VYYRIATISLACSLRVLEKDKKKKKQQRFAAQVMAGKVNRGGGGKRGGLRGNGSRIPGGGRVRGVGGAVGGFGRGGLGVAPTGGKVRKDKTQRFGKLVNEKDQIEHGRYIPWARAQTPGSVKEVQFNAESRAAYLTGFRKRKAERQVVAKKTVSTKEKNEIRKGRRDRKRELMGKYEDRVAQMKKIADEAKRLEKLKELGLPLPSDDDRSGCTCFSVLRMYVCTRLYLCMHVYIYADVRVFLRQ